MLHREDREGLILVSQPGHAWVSGQMARAWGNDLFGAVAPREDVCLAAEQHDVGFLDWEMAPTFNPQTHRPHNFMDMPLDAHLAVWSIGVQKMKALGRYATLLVSLHNTGLCARHVRTDSPAAAQSVKDFLQDQHAEQSDLLTSLRADPLYAEHSTVDRIARNRMLIATWDWLSLLLCTGFSEEQVIEDVPALAGMRNLRLKATGTPNQFVVEPWPFASRFVELVFEGKRLPDRCGDETAMRAALNLALPVALRVRLNDV
jgi:hypothetical protein